MADEGTENNGNANAAADAAAAAAAAAASDTQNQQTAKQQENGSPDANAAASPFAELDPETREWLEKREIKDANAAAKLAREQSKLLGNAIRMPGKDAKPEEVEAFLNKLGRPETPDKYEFTVPESLPEDLPYDAERANAFKKKAHELGLTAAQAQAVHDWAVENAVGDFNTALQSQNEQTAERAKQETDKLVKLWGPLDGETAKANLAFADKALTEAGGPEVLAELQRVGLIGPDKVILSQPIAVMMANLGMAIYKEDTVLRGDPAAIGNPFAEGPAFNVTEQMKAIRANRDHAMSLIAAAGKKPSDFGLSG